MPSCLLTGAGGFLGNYLARELSAQGWDVFALYRHSLPPKLPGIIPVQGDLLFPQKWIEELPQHLTACLHFAAMLPFPEGTLAQYAQVNTAGTAAILDIAQTRRAKTLLYASSAYLWETPPDGVITEKTPPAPVHPYHISKLEGERLCLSFRNRPGRRAIALRIASPYGKGMPPHTVIGKFLSSAHANSPLCIHGEGKRLQNFIHALDVAGGALAALEHGDGVYQIAFPQSISMRELAQIILKAYGLPPTQFTLLPEQSEGPSWCFDCSKARTELRFTASIPPESGMTDMVSRLYAHASH